MSDSLNTGFSQYNVPTDTVFKSTIPSLMEVNVGLDQMGFDYKVKSKYQLERPSGYDNITDKLIKLLVTLKNDFRLVLVNVDDDKHPMSLEPIRINKSSYEHDLFDLASKMGDDVAHAMTRGLRTQNNWDFVNSGFGRQVPRTLYGRKNTHTAFKHPIIYLDNYLFDCFSLDNSEMTDDILRVTEDLKFYFRRLEPIMNYIRFVNPRFKMLPVEQDQIDHEWYFPHDKIRYDYGQMIVEVPAFKIYVINKVKSLVESSLKMGLNSTSEVASKLNDILELQAMTAQSGNKVSNFLNPDSAVRLTRSLLINGMLSFTKTSYEISNFKEGDEVTLLDCMLLPLVAPYRVWDDLTICRCLNYVVTHFVSAISPLRRNNPMVMERASEAPTYLLDGLEQSSVQNPPVQVPVQGRDIGALARALRDYFSSGSDGIAISDRLIGGAYVPPDATRAYVEQIDNTDLPFNVSNGIQFQSFFEVQPEHVVDAAMPVMPNKWAQFLTLVDVLTGLQYTRGNKQNRNVVSILESLAVNSDQYFVYASRIMDQMRSMSLYPHACVGEIQDVLDEPFVMDNVAKVNTHVAEKGSIMSFIRMQNWDESLIELTDTSFIQEGIMDVLALNDVTMSLADVDYLDSAFHTVITNETGRRFGRKRSRTAKFANAEQCLLYNTGRHQVMKDMIYPLSNGVKERMAAYGNHRHWTDCWEVLFAYPEIFGFTMDVMFRPRLIHDGEVDTFPNIPRVRMFSSSTIAKVPDGPVVYRDAADVANYGPLPDGESYRIRFPYAETMFEHLQTFQMLKSDTHFKMFAIIDNSKGGTVAPPDTVIDDMHNGRIPVINVGWTWKFDTTLQMYKTLLNNVDFASIGTNHWFHYFVSYNNVDRITAAAVVQLGNAFVNARDDLDWPEDFEQFITQSAAPFVPYHHISLNMYKTNEFPVLTTTA
jgi:hypothetical protein